MKNFFNSIKNLSSKCTLFAFTFVMSYLPACVLAADIPSNGLLHVAHEQKWYSSNCPLGTMWGGKCITCPLFKTLFDAASKLCVRAYDTLHYSMMILVALGTALWIALKLIRYLSGFEQIETMKMLQDLANQLFRSLIIIVILSAHYESVRKLTLDPVFDTGMNITQTLVNNGRGCASVGTSVREVKGGLSKNMGNSILCSVYMVEQKAMETIDVGHTIFCVGVNDKGKKIFGFTYWPKWSYLITGICLMLIGSVYLLGCPFLLVDCVVNLCFAVTVMPVAVAGYAFKLTSKYLKTVWDTFMSAMFNFLFLALIIYILNQAIEGIFYYPKNESILSNVAHNRKGIDAIGNVVYGITISSINFLKLGFIFFLGWSVLKKAGETAQEFAGSGMNPAKGIGSDMGAQAAHGLRKAGKGVGGAALNAAKTFAIKSGFSDWAKSKREQLKSLNPIRAYAKSATHQAFKERRAENRQQRFDRKEARREERQIRREERQVRRQELFNNSILGKVHNSETMTRIRNRVSNDTQALSNWNKKMIGAGVDSIRNGHKSNMQKIKNLHNSFVETTNAHLDTMGKIVNPVRETLIDKPAGWAADKASKIGKDLKNNLREMKDDLREKIRDRAQDIDEALSDKIRGVKRTSAERAETREQEKFDKLVNFEKRLTDEEKNKLSQERYGMDYKDLSTEQTERLLKETISDKGAYAYESVVEDAQGAAFHVNERMDASTDIAGQYNEIMNDSAMSTEDKMSRLADLVVMQQGGDGSEIVVLGENQYNSFSDRSRNIEIRFNSQEEANAFSRAMEEYNKHAYVDHNGKQHNFKDDSSMQEFMQRDMKEAQKEQSEKPKRADYRTVEEKARGIELSEEEWRNRWEKDQRRKRKAAEEAKIAAEKEERRRKAEEEQRLYDMVYGNINNSDDDGI